MFRFYAIAIAVLFCSATHAWAQADQPTAPTVIDMVDLSKRAAGRTIPDAENERLASSELLSTTVLADRISYRAHVNRTPVHDRHDVMPDFDVVSFSYEADGPDLDRQRPVFFFFNGGPGSSTIWLHLTAFGPEKVSVDLTNFSDENRDISQAPNPGFLIDIGDLVFVDPVGTGLSRPVGEAPDTAFRDMRVDARAMCRFAETWLAATQRTDAPVYLVGSSYGALRVAGMTSHPSCRDLRRQVRGLVFLSGLLDLRARASRSPLRMMGAFPTWAAVAWHHGRVNRAPWGFNIGAYLEAAKAVSLEATSAAWITELSGQDTATVQQQRLIDFLGLTEIVRPESSMRAGYNAMVSRVAAGHRLCDYDARFQCRPGEHLPSIKLIEFADALEDRLADYLKTSMDYDLDQESYIAFRDRGFAANWDFRFLKSSDGGRGTNMAELLGKMNRKIMVASGAYDITTPFYAMELALRGAEHPDESLTIKTYNGGHIMYLDEAVGRQLADDIRSFVRANESPSQ